MTIRVFAGTGLLLAGGFIAGCGGGASTTPNPLPTPQSTPTPVPTPTPTPAEIACNNPVPPPLYGFRVKVHQDQGYKKILDSRALVGKDAAYCGGLGYGGDICVVRDENAPDAITCNNYVIGIASQTGRYGPNWFWNGQPCRGINEGGDEPGCKQHPTNQYMLFAFGPGTFTACGDHDRVCHAIEFP